MDESPPGREELRESERARLRQPVLAKRIRMTESELQRRARQIGTAAGTVVALLRDARRELDERDPWKTTNPLSDLRPTARGHTQESGYAAALHAQEWRRAALERLADVGESPEVGRLRAFGRAKSSRRKRVRPIILAAAILVLLAGAGLKAWMAR